MPRVYVVTLIMSVLVSSGLVYLWYTQNQTLNALRHDVVFLTTQKPNLISTPIASSTADLNSLHTEIATLTRRLDILENLPTPTTQKISSQKPVPFQNQILTLGSASSTNRNWTPTGLEITINSANYPSTVMAYFEAGLNCFGCIAGARVTNKTTGAIINITEVFHDTGTVTYKRSTGFKLHPGKNTYIIELRSSSGEAANLSSSRILIENP